MKERRLRITKWLTAVLMAVMFVFMASGIGDVKAADSTGTWVADIFGWRYQEEDGTYVKNDFARINGKRYHFDENGYMETGWIKRVWPDGDVFWYYADGTGALVSGWRQIDGTWYYFMLTGMMARDTYVDNGRYYVNANGAWVDKSEAGRWIHDGIGWWYQKADGSYPKQGAYRVDGDWYGFDENGYMLVGWCKPYGSGSARWYYFDGDGRSAKGWRELNGIWYYFDENGYMYHDTWIGTYYLDGDGAWQPMSGTTNGQWVKNSVGWWYQYADGTYPADGMWRINGTFYYFNESGYMLTGWVNVNGSDSYPEWHYFDASGAEVYGWRQINGTWYYFHEYGDMAYDEYVGSYWLDSSGAWTDPPAYAR